MEIATNWRRARVAVAFLHFVVHDDDTFAHDEPMVLLLPYTRSRMRAVQGLLGADTTHASLNAGTGTGSHQCRRRQRQDTRVSPKPAQEAAVVADSNLLGLVKVGVAAEAHRYLLAILIPADGYDPQTANGVFSHGFGNQRNGSIGATCRRRSRDCCSQPN